MRERERESQEENDYLNTDKKKIIIIIILVNKKMRCCVGPRSKAGTETKQTNVFERKMCGCINTLLIMTNWEKIQKTYKKELL